MTIKNIWDDDDLAAADRAWDQLRREEEQEKLKRDRKKPARPAPDPDRKLPTDRKSD